MSTHNICFRREIRKILCGYPLLSVAMLPTSDHEVLGSNPTRNPAHYYMPLNCTEPFIITLPSSRYDLSDVERDGKHQIIIIVSSRAFLLRGQDILSRFSAIFYKETTLMTSSLLF